MQTLRIFLYDQTIPLQISDDYSITVEDRAVYSKPINLFKGIDNPIKLLIKNSDQKAIDISMLTFYAELVRTPQQDFVASFTATPVTAAAGIAQIVIPASVINPEPVGYYRLLIKYSQGSSTFPAYSDDNYGVAIPVFLQLGYRVSGDVYELGENLDLGSIPELVDENRDLGAL
jgi:hypothetical protein